MAQRRHDVESAALIGTDEVDVLELCASVSLTQHQRCCKEALSKSQPNDVIGE